MKISMLGNTTKQEIEKRLQIIASAGMLSRSSGTVTKVIENNLDYEHNLKLIKNIIGIGHKSIIEHDYLVFALEDVTPIIEQTIISYRLTSFTIKSRRNVDFRNSGFYVPDFKNKSSEILPNNLELKKFYVDYMKSLFDKYSDLVDDYLPIEDCRYVLPYSYYSNIIMGCDANELLRMTSDMLYGKLSSITEIRDFALNIQKQMSDFIPYLIEPLEKEQGKSYYYDKYSFLDELVGLNSNVARIFSKPIMTNYKENSDDTVLCNIIMNRYQVSLDEASSILNDLFLKYPDIKIKLMNSLIQSKDQRELEQVMFSFELPISLAVLTHITRHRMHSLLIPDFVPLWNMNNYIIPDTLKENHYDDIKAVFDNNKKMVDIFKGNGVRDEDLVYFYLSGNMCNIYTSMNARTLEWISRMRCCKKAQWEIRNLVNEMVSQVKDVAPLIGMSLGPSCEVLNYCPEGKDSCKKRGVIVKQK